MQVLNKKSVGEALAMESLAELHKVKETVGIYEQKYGKSLAQFEHQLENEQEEFEHYDDYIDWKAAVKWQDVLEERIEELKHGNFKVT